MVWILISTDIAELSAYNSSEELNWIEIWSESKNKIYPFFKNQLHGPFDKNKKLTNYCKLDKTIFLKEFFEKVTLKKSADSQNSWTRWQNQMALNRSPEFCLNFFIYMYLLETDHAPGDPQVGPIVNEAQWTTHDAQ